MGWKLGGTFFVLTVLSGGALARQSAPPSLDGLEMLFTPGVILQDRNDDGAIDFVNARIVLPEKPSVAEVSTAAGIAARLGFETSAMNLPITGEAPTDAVLILIGAATLEIVGGSARDARVSSLKPGEGVVALVSARERPAVVIAGSDEPGLSAAADLFAGRLPHVWDPSGVTLHQAGEQLGELLRSRDVTISDTHVTAVVARSGVQGVAALELDARLASDEAVSKAKSILPRTSLPFTGASTMRVRLLSPSGKAVPVEVKGAAASSVDGPLGPRPGSAAKDNLDLSNLYTPEGLLGDSDENLIPDRVDALLSPWGEGLSGTVDLGARLGLESTGFSIPAARAVSTDDPESEPTLVLIGRNHPLTERLVGEGKLKLPALEPGQGIIQVVPRAFGEKTVVVITGADPAGLERALQQVSERLPHVWSRGKDRTTLEGVEEDVWRLLSGRSPEGQAATALYRLEKLAGELAGKDLESAEVTFSLEKADAGLASYLDREVRAKLRADSVSVVVDERDVQKAAKLIDEDFEIASEVEEFWTIFRSRLLPKVTKGRTVVVQALLSEPPEIRELLAKDALAELQKAGATADSSVTVLSAYKQGYSWLYDVVRPALAGKPIEKLTIRFAETGPPEEWPQQTMFAPARWLMETFPADEVLARELRLEPTQVVHEKMPIGDTTYEVVATGADGTEILRDTFEPRWVLRNYFDVLPDYEKVRVTTGWITARVGDTEVVSQRIATEPERFWDHYQSQTLSSIYDYVMKLHKGKPRPQDAPYFGELTVDLTLSEPNFMLGIDEEQISSLEAVQEEIYFVTLQFFDVMGRFARGEALNHIGRVIPIVRPKSDGKAGRARITLTGFASSRPGVTVRYRERGGPERELRRDVLRALMDRPRALGALVRDGRNGIEQLDVRIKVDTDEDERAELVRAATGGVDQVDREILSAEQVEAVIGKLSALRAAGLYREGLAYHDLGRIRISAGWNHDVGSAAQREVLLDPNGAPPPFPDIRTLLPAGYSHAGEPLVQWDTPIPPPEAYEVLAKMSTFEEATVYKVGQSYLGKDIWAVDLMPPIEASHWSQAKASTLKPTVVYSARQHANEVSSTSHVLKLAELLLTDPESRKKLDKVNVVIHPITNPDGAQLAYDLYKITPNHMLHPGYLASLGADPLSHQWDDDARIYPEAKVRPLLWRTWLPDIFLNPHGMPSHEWVQLFSEYAAWVRNRVVEPRAWMWPSRGWYMPGFHYIDDPKYPRHKEAAFEILERITTNMNAAADVRAMNQRAYNRYRRYGEFDPDSFRMGFHNEVMIHSELKGVKPDPRASDFMPRNPRVTIWTGITEAPDETAKGDWLKLVATAGLQWDKAILDYLVEGDHRIERDNEVFYRGIRWSIDRPRPPKKEESEKKAPTLGVH
jgi:hypothetical protein